MDIPKDWSAPKPETPPGWPTMEEINKILQSQPVQEQVLFKIGMAVLGAVNAGGDMEKVGLLLSAVKNSLGPLGFEKSDLRAMLLGGLSLVSAFCIMAQANGGKPFIQEIHHDRYGHVDIQSIQREGSENAE